MKNKLILMFFLAFLSLFELKASHLMGGDITYQNLVPGVYKIKFKFYRDCSGIQLGGPSITMFCENYPGSPSSLNYTRTAINNITPSCGNNSTYCYPANTYGTSGYEEHIFEAIVDFNTNPFKAMKDAGCCKFKIQMSQCCRNSILTTLTPGNYYVDAMMDICNIEKTNIKVNSSPLLLNQPVLRACCNQPLKYNFGAVESIDGDSLSFELVSPLRGNNTNEIYLGAFNSQIPMTPYCPPNVGTINCSPLPNANPPRGFYFNKVTGDIIFTPTKCDEAGIIALQVNEWRKDSSTQQWMLLGYIKREMQVIISNCDTTSQPPTINNSRSVYDICEGDSTSFDIRVQDPNSSDTLKIDVFHNIPNTTYQVIENSSSDKIIRVTVKTKVGDSRLAPYAFVVNAEDNACPFIMKTSQGFSVSIRSRPMVNRKFTEQDSQVVFEALDNKSATYEWTIKNENDSIIKQSTEKRDSFRLDWLKTYYIKLDYKDDVSCKHSFYDTIVTKPNFKKVNIRGGDISYQNISPDVYKITFKIYRDCSGVPLNSPSFGIMRDDGVAGSMALNFTRTAINNITPSCVKDSIYCNPVNQYGSTGFEEHIFEAIVDFNDTQLSAMKTQGNCKFKIYMSQCCKDENITTISPGNFYVDAMMDICNIEKTNVKVNSTPLLMNLPVLKACCNKPLRYNLGAVESKDGDSLSYELVSILNNTNSFENYNGSFNSQIPMTPYCPPNVGTINCSPLPNANPPRGFYFDKVTGDIVFTPTKCDETGIIALQVNEWRKDSSTQQWLHIGYIKREMQIIVYSCDTVSQPPTIDNSTNIYNICEGDSTSFDIHVQDQNSSDTVDIDVFHSMPNATYQVIENSSSDKIIRVTVKTKIGDSRLAPYAFVVNAKDNSCPFNLKTSQGFSISIRPRHMVNREFTEQDSQVIFQALDNNTATYHWTIKNENDSTIKQSTEKRDSFRLEKDKVYYIKLDYKDNFSCVNSFYDTIVTKPDLNKVSIRGGDISYQNVSPDVYKITFKIYRDCSGVPLNSPSFGIMRDDGVAGSMALNFTRIAINNITPSCVKDSTYCNPVNQYGSTGFEEHIFEATVDFNDAPLSAMKSQGNCKFKIYMSQCCKGENITTLSSGNFYVDAMMDICNIEKTNVKGNSTPLLMNLPVLKACCNKPLRYNLGAVESKDGDSLSYELVSILNNTNSFENYTGSFNSQIPMTPYCPPNIGTINCNPLPYANPPRGFYFDKVTGDIVFTPTKCDETGIIALQVNEWRINPEWLTDKNKTKWLLIGFIKREMQVIISTCDTASKPPTIDNSTNVYDICEGDSISFDIQVQDQNSNDTVDIDVFHNMPNTTYQVIENSSSDKIIRVTVKTEIGDGRLAPYALVVNARDNSCPYVLKTSQGFSVTVRPKPMVNRKYTEQDSQIVFEVLRNKAASYNWTIKNENDSTIKQSTEKRDSFKSEKDKTYYIKLDYKDDINCENTFFDTISTQPNLNNAILNSYKTTIIVYPNPSNGNITVEGFAIQTSLIVYDIHGREILKKDSEANENKLTLSLPKGIYLFKFTENKTISVQKVIVY
jgi:hypothetical protein